MLESLHSNSLHISQPSINAVHYWRPLMPSINAVHSYLITRVASRFGILVWYRSVFSQYFTNQYQRKTENLVGTFRYPTFGGNPFFPSKGDFCPLFDGPSPPFEGQVRSPQIYEKELPQNFTKWSSCQILQYKITEPNIDRQVPATYQYQPNCQ